jgi:dienelactone hydrolase
MYLARFGRGCACLTRRLRFADHKIEHFRVGSTKAGSERLTGADCIAQKEGGPYYRPSHMELVFKTGQAIRRIAMSRLAKMWFASFLLCIAGLAHGQTPQSVVDIPTRPDVTQRMLVLSPPNPRAAVILMAGGHGGLQISPDGAINWGAGNFLVRTRQLFADQGFLVVVVDAPSDRQRWPFLTGYRQTPAHVVDIKAVIAWLRERTKVPVWLIGTSRGTQSAAYIATELLSSEGPDGLVLSSTILTDKKGRPVPAMSLEKIRIPVLVVHHQEDGCPSCAFSEVPALMEKLKNSPRTQLLSFSGGENRGDPCEAFAYHGFNGLERDVVGKIAASMLGK